MWLDVLSFLTGYALFSVRAQSHAHFCPASYNDGMKTDSFSDLHVDWLTDPAADDVATSFPATLDLQRHELPIATEIGHGWFERLPLALGVMVLHGVHRFRPEAAGQLITLGEFKLEFPETTLAVQTMHRGAAFHREFHPPAELYFKPGFDFFRHADRFHTISQLDTSCDSEMTGVHVTDTALVELMGEELAQQLLAGLGLGTPPAVKVIAMPLQVSAPLRACVSPTLQGALKKLFAQAKVLEYLCALSAQVAESAPATAQIKREDGRISELHDYLAQLDGKLPTLDELAQRYGMSARVLNDKFIRQYGMPIYSFIANRRLIEAHLALLESALPIKTISHRLGYSHVNHFTIAFKKKFGYPPGSLRREKRAGDAARLQ